jgi:hypothetical protein
MWIGNKTLKNPKWKGRCSLRAIPFLPGYKLAFEKKKRIAKVNMEILPFCSPKSLAKGDKA